ncbi:ATP-binding cassette domain-containing protein [Pontibacillus salicampi]|uniref:ATP-binding cassette domain-containing protein n=1 Tax=Pontibacillus salicampi TaxID=1449801 RepID=A0ABV6LJT3_9BACI
MDDVLYHFQHIHKHTLQDVSFQVKKEEKVVVFGPSGAGKSTLLHLFNRLQDPEEGTILFKGKDITTYEIPTLRREAGLVLQAPNLFPGTVLDNIKYGPELCKRWKDEYAEKLLEYVQLPKEMLHRVVDQLSGGEKQRVSLARTLANEPDVLLLDEPTSALDQHTMEDIEEVLNNLIRVHQLTMVMVTHNLRQARRLGDKGIFLSDGRIEEVGPIDELLDNPQSESLKYFLA